MTPARKRANKKWARLNREYFQDWKMDFYSRRLEFMRCLKNRPCADCGGWFNPWQMDFDHRDQRTKLKSVSGLLFCKVTTMLDEIKKCDLICANCHRDRTYKRRQFYAVEKLPN